MQQGKAAWDSVRMATENAGVAALLVGAGGMAAAALVGVAGWAVAGALLMLVVSLAMTPKDRLRYRELVRRAAASDPVVVRLPDPVALLKQRALTVGAFSVVAGAVVGVFLAAAPEVGGCYAGVALSCGGLFLTRARRISELEQARGEILLVGRRTRPRRAAFGTEK